MNHQAFFVLQAHHCWDISANDTITQYLLNKEQQSFTSALLFCSRNGGQVLKIRSKAEQDYVHAKYVNFVPDSIWLNALQTAKNSRIFTWLDDSRTANVDCSSGYRSNLNNDCVALLLQKTSNKFCDWKCEGKMSVVCEKGHNMDFYEGKSDIEQLGRFINGAMNNMSADIANIKSSLDISAHNSSQNFEVAILNQNEHNRGLINNIAVYQGGIKNRLQSIEYGLTLYINPTDGEIQLLKESNNVTHEFQERLESDLTFMRTGVMLYFITLSILLIATSLFYGIYQLFIKKARPTTVRAELTELCTFD